MQERLKKSFTKIGLGLTGILLLTFIFYVSLNFSWGIHLWTIENIKPELSGNPALDEQIIRAGGEQNFMMLFLGTTVWAGIIIFGYKSIACLTEGINILLKDLKGR